jgi:pentatricopeptide repeat protein
MNESDKFEDSVSDHDLMSQLQAYIDIYIMNGMLQKAESILMLSTKKLKQNKTNSAQLYNMLMEAYISHNMQLEKLLDLHNMMKEHSVQPNAETYSLLFHMIAKMKDHGKQKGE